ncbi:MAG: phosphotransferase [Alteromonadaceae bacterium]|nr:phosphotransferase [Alteromonadaceae bacterium]
MTAPLLPTHLEKQNVIQSLWSDYGEISRYKDIKSNKNVILKLVNPPETIIHPRGWVSDLSHQRKLRSYQVEIAFYEGFAQRCRRDCRVAEHLNAYYDFTANEGQYLLFLEDLCEAGFTRNHRQVTRKGINSCIKWLGNFHGNHIYSKPEKLWATGGYWHLATRPDELANMAFGSLKMHAEKIDALLHEHNYKTIIHGDAKLANFLFFDDESQAAAYDFQYAGGGIGVQDLVLLLCSVLTNKELYTDYERLVELYFTEFKRGALWSLTYDDCKIIEDKWRSLLPVAWADYHRFLAGWSPQHARITPFMDEQTQLALKQLKYL